MNYGKNNKRGSGRVFVAHDPEYTLAYVDLFRITGLARHHIHKAMRDGTFPRPKEFDNKTSRWHPDHIEAWLRCRSLGLVWSATDGK